MVNVPTLGYADYLALKENSQPLTKDGYFVFLQMPEGEQTHSIAASRGGDQSGKA